MKTESFISTSHGVLAIEESGRGDLPVVLIHGNSSFGRVFRQQLELACLSDCRVIAVDLPGHGRSEDAIDPNRTYTLPGLADAVSETLETMQVIEPAIVGWSLGGHIAIEMLHRLEKMRALLLCGAPPVGKLEGRNNMAEGLNSFPNSLTAPNRGMTELEAHSFVDYIFRSPVENLLIEAAVRTDGRFRRRLFESSLEGLGVNQKSTVEHASLTIAVVNGEQDNVIKSEFFQQVRFQNLWENKIHVIEHAGHAPFWENPVQFNRTLQRFLSDILGSTTA